MRSSNNDNVTANDGEWCKHRNKDFKKITSKLRRKNGKKIVKDQEKDS